MHALRTKSMRTRTYIPTTWDVHNSVRNIIFHVVYIREFLLDGSILFPCSFVCMILLFCCLCFLLFVLWVLFEPGAYPGYFKGECGVQQKEGGPLEKEKFEAPEN